MKNTLIIAGIFVAFGVVGTIDYDAERMAELERENEHLRTYAQTHLSDCAAPQTTITTASR